VLHSENRRRAKLLVAEMNWLRTLSGLSKLERKRNEEIKQELGQIITFLERIHKQRLVAWTCQKNE